MNSSSNQKKEKKETEYQVRKRKEKMLIISLIDEEKGTLFAPITNAITKTKRNEGWKRVFSRCQALNIDFAMKEAATWESLRDNKWSKWQSEAAVRYR